MATIKIPPVLRASVGGEKQVRPPARTSARCCATWPPPTRPPQGQLFAAEGELNRYVNVYLNDEDVRVLDGLDTAVGDSDTLVILPRWPGRLSRTVHPRSPRCRIWVVLPTNYGR